MTDELSLGTPSPKWPKPATKAPVASPAPKPETPTHRRGDNQMNCQHGAHYQACEDCHPPADVVRERFGR